MVLNRRDIVGINLNPKKGDEIGKVRPCIILSDDDSNEILDTIIVVPLSTKLIENMEPFRLRLFKKDSLKENSDILINHIRTISKKRVTSHIGKISQGEYKEIIENLCQMFKDIWSKTNLKWIWKYQWSRFRPTTTKFIKLTHSKLQRVSK